MKFTSSIFFHFLVREYFYGDNDVYKHVIHYKYITGSMLLFVMNTFPYSWH